MKISNNYNTETLLYRTKSFGGFTIRIVCDWKDPAPELILHCVIKQIIFILKDSRKLHIKTYMFVLQNISIL